MSLTNRLQRRRPAVILIQLLIVASSLVTGISSEQEIVPHTEKKKVLVTGGAGFIGSHTVDAFLARGDDVVLVDEMNDYYDVAKKEANLQYLQSKYGANNTNGAQLTIYRGDFCDADMMTNLFETEKPTWICHLGARAGVRPSIEDPFVYVHSNVEGTVRLLELSRKHGVENFVFASSSSVYGGSDKSLFSEDDLVDRPISPYAATKKSTELFGYTYNHLYGLNVTALRFFTVYGPRGRPDMAPFKFIDRVSRGEQLQQFGDGSTSRDYTYIEDIVDGVVRAVDRPYPYHILNLGKGSGTKLSEFVDLVQKHVGKEANIEILPEQPGDVPYTCANVTLAATRLGYKPSVMFEEGIRRTVEWYKSTYPTEESHARRRLRARAAALETTDVLDWNTAENEVAPSSRRRLQEVEVGPSAGDWESITPLMPLGGKKKVLVTGAAGFIASHVAEALLARGDEVIIVDEMNDYYDVSIKEANLKDLSDRFGEDQLKIVRGDIADNELMTSIFEKERPEWICHLAARAGVRPSIDNPFAYVHSNVLGTTRLLDLAHRYKVKNFVFASSSSVYGGSTSTLFSEDELVDFPISPYAASKKSSELMAYTYHHLYDLNVTGLRFFTVYGPRGRPDMAPFKFIESVRNGITIQQFGDGSSSRDYTYIDDIVDGVVRAIDRPYGYQIFNLGKGSGTKLSEFIKLIEEYTGSTANIDVLPDQPGDVPYTCADVRKAEHLLGYKSQVSISEGLQKTVAWFDKVFPLEEPPESASDSDDSTTDDDSRGFNGVDEKPGSITDPAAAPIDYDDAFYVEVEHHEVGWSEAEKIEFAAREREHHGILPRWMQEVYCFEWATVAAVAYLTMIGRTLLKRRRIRSE